MLVEEVQLVFDSLLVQSLDDHVTGAVRGVAGASNRSFAKVPGVTAETPLIYLTARSAIEGQAHVLQLKHGVHRFAGKDFCGVLIDKVVTALDGVEHVPFPVIFLDVAERGADAALGRAGMGSWGIELTGDGDISLAGELDRGHESGSAGAN